MNRLQFSIAKSIENGIRCASSIFVKISMGMLLALMFLGSGDVIGRYFFNIPITGSMEISTLLLAGIVFFGWPHTQEMDGNIRVKFLISVFPPWAQVISDFFSHLVGLILFGLITWQGLEMALVYWKVNRLVDVVYLPLAYFQLFVPIGGGLLCIELIIEIVYIIYAFKER